MADDNHDFWLAYIQDGDTVIILTYRQEPGRPVDCGGREVTGDEFLEAVRGLPPGARLYVAAPVDGSTQHLVDNLEQLAAAKGLDFAAVPRPMAMTAEAFFGGLGSYLASIPVIQ